MLDMITFVTFDVKIASYYNLSFNLLPIIVSVVWKMLKNDTKEHGNISKEYGNIEKKNYKNF